MVCIASLNWPRARITRSRMSELEMALKSLAGALDLQKWKGPGKEIFVSLAMMQPPIDGEQNRVNACCKHDQQEGHRHDQINVVQADCTHQ
jgi:hypothetical protein